MRGGVVEIGVDGEIMEKPDFEKMSKWQSLEIEWYRRNGKYSERVKRTKSGDLFVIGDYSWNSARPQKPEYIEKRMSSWIESQFPPKINLDNFEVFKPSRRNKRNSISGKQIVDLRTNKKMSYQQIALKLGISKSSVALHLRKTGQVNLGIRVKPASTRPRTVNLSKGFLFNERVTKRKTLAEIAKKANCSYESVRLKLKEFGIVKPRSRKRKETLEPTSQTL